MPWVSSSLNFNYKSTRQRSLRVHTHTLALAHTGKEGRNEMEIIKQSKFHLLTQNFNSFATLKILLTYVWAAPRPLSGPTAPTSAWFLSTFDKVYNWVVFFSLSARIDLLFTVDFLLELRAQRKLIKNWWMIFIEFHFSITHTETLQYG